MVQHMVTISSSDPEELLFMPLLKKGAYCLHFLVGLSVDQVMSAQYLLTPLLESCQTWYSGSP